MKRFLISFLVLGLMAGSVATAEAKREPAPVERTVEGSYDAPFVYFVSTCAQSGGNGCVSIATGETERFLRAKVTDAHGLPVSVMVQANTQNDVLGDEITFGTFCGQTAERISFQPGVELEFYVGVPSANCSPGIATTGTISATLSRAQAGPTGRLKITASDGSASERFGISVAVSGDTAVVGAPHEGSPLPTEHGAAYVFTRTAGTWTEQAKLTAADGSEADRFGFSVAVSGDTAVVGAFWDDVGGNSNQGSAYVFTRTGETWTQQAKLTAPDGAATDQFGYSVAVSSDTAVVGAVGGDVGSNGDQGSAYVFSRTAGTWTEQAKLTAADGSAGDAFGQSVSVSSDTAVVGAVYGDVGTNLDQGSAYVFNRTAGTWTEQAKLTAPDGSAGDQFGFWVGVDGDTAVVGAPFDDVSAADQGSAYVFSRTAGTWTEQAKLTAADGSAVDLFGRSVAVSGDTILVGAQYDDVGASIKQGSAYVFTPSGGTWTEQTKLSASEGAAGALFGVSVAVSGDSAVVGAGFQTVDGNVHQGAAYFFRDVAPAMTVTIDVKPGDENNRIRISSTEAIPVAVMTTPSFDATTVDPSRVCFGDDPPHGGTTEYGQPPGVDADCNESHRRGHIGDIDNDGDLDMLLLFDTPQTGIDAGDAVARLTGRTTGGSAFEGSDSIRTVQ